MMGLIQAAMERANRNNPGGKRATQRGQVTPMRTMPHPRAFSPGARSRQNTQRRFFAERRQPPNAAARMAAEEEVCEVIEEEEHAGSATTESHDSRTPEATTGAAEKERAATAERATPAPDLRANVARGLEQAGNGAIGIDR